MPHDKIRKRVKFMLMLEVALYIALAFFLVFIFANQ
jgi:hypothetical protein